MDEKYVKYVWTILKTTVQKVQEQYSELDSEQTYSKAYERVMDKHGFHLYNGLREHLTEELQQKVRPEVLESIAQDNLLGKLKAFWTSHQITMLMIKDMLGPLDLYYTMPRGLDKVYKLGLRIFRDEIVRFPDIQKALQYKLLGMIEKERFGGMINQSEIKDACSLLITLGLESRYTYEQIFEQSFLTELAAFYEIESHNLVKNNPKDYITEMNARLLKESTRAALYLDKDTVPHIVRVLEQIIEKDKPV